MLSTIVHARRCAPPLLYILLYDVDVQAAGQLGQTLARQLLFTGLGLFVPKPTRDVVYHHYYSV